MATGTVKWFSNAKGYGFISPDDGQVAPETSAGEVFAHFSAIDMDGYKSLRPGMRVHYELHDGPKGVHALNICAVTPDGAPAPAGTQSSSADQSS